jgi:predicted nucleotidyltransferase
VTLAPAEAEQLERVVALVPAVLGPELVGVYLFGSATMGGLRPRSDIDVLAVTRRPLTPTERRLLVEGLLAASLRPRPIELTIVVKDEIRPWRHPPRREFQYGDWLRTELESGTDATAATVDPDLASLIRMTLLTGRPLLGPPPAEVFEPVPDDDFRRAMAACIDDVLRGLDEDTRNMVLTLARVWCSVETGAIHSKDEAAAWALERLPDEHRPVLERARAVYLGEAEERWDDLGPQVRPHADYVAEEVRRLLGTT